jgi:hypothetical protein
VQRGTHGPSNLSGPSRGRPRHPSGKPLPRSRAWRRATESPPRSRVGRPLGRISASLEGWTPSRANLCLARGRPELAAPAPTPSTRALNAFDMMRAPGSKANPRHASPLTPPGNRISALFRQPALCGHPQHCAGAVWEGRCQLCDTVPPTPVRSPCCTPQKRVAEPSKEVQMPAPHPRRTTP